MGTLQNLLGLLKMKELLCTYAFATSCKEWILNEQLYGILNKWGCWLKEPVCLRDKWKKQVKLFIFIIVISILILFWRALLSRSLFPETEMYSSFFFPRKLKASTLKKWMIHYLLSLNWTHLELFASCRNLQLSAVLGGVMSGCHNTLEVAP